MAEAAVNMIKTSISKTGDPYTTFVPYGTTPLKNAYSPARLLMGRCLRTKLYQATRPLLPATPDIQAVWKFEEVNRGNQCKYYKYSHGFHGLVDLNGGVWVTDMKKNGKVAETTSKPRYFILHTGEAVVRRNRTHLVPLP